MFAAAFKLACVSGLVLDKGAVSVVCSLLETTLIGEIFTCHVALTVFRAVFRSTFVFEAVYVVFAHAVKVTIDEFTFDKISVFEFQLAFAVQLALLKHAFDDLALQF